MHKKLFSRSSDVFLALFVVAIAVLLLVPIHPSALDFLLAVNIAFALLLLLVGLYMPNALALLAFPVVLLLTTLFRLGLNVASTRLILSDGEAGRVIEAFGSFLIGGEMVVGVIIFVILLVVNFVVIARGASRVSEVAARFALESLPGKQMAIDADLRTGLIDTRQAQERREDLRKESQLYGAMDGAMKFVQGDVIAGFFITLTNILGGLYMGIYKHEMDFGEAIDTYTMLTIGDGLVTQIPALLISICAGVVVTRVSSGENTTLGADIGAQLFTRPSLLFLAGMIVLIIGFLPGLPLLPFFTVALLLTGIAYMLRKSQAGGLVSFPFLLEGGSKLTGLPMGGEISGVIEEEGQALVLLDSSVLFKRYAENAQFYQEWWRELQVDFFFELGLKLPGLRVMSDEYLAGSHYSLLLNDVQVESAGIASDSLMVEVNPDSAEIFGMHVLQVTEHPVSGGRVFWAAKTDSLVKILEAGRIRSFDFMQYICLRAAVFVARNPEEVLNIADVHSMLKQLEQQHPGLAADALNSDFLNVFRITEILQELAREGIAIKDFKQVFESVASYCSTYGLSMVQQNDFDVQDIISYIRIDRKRHSISRLLSDRGTLKVVTLSQELEELLEESDLDSSGVALAIEPDRFERMVASLSSILHPLKVRGLLPVSILCRSDLRYRVASFLRACNNCVSVIAFEELDPQVVVEPTGVWEV